MEQNNLPLGFSFALAQRPEAMKQFSNLSEAKRSKILQKARAVSSKQEMQALVDKLSAET